jgi:hypothetical protein
MTRCASKGFIRNPGKVQESRRLLIGSRWSSSLVIGLLIDDTVRLERIYKEARKSTGIQEVIIWGLLFW